LILCSRNTTLTIHHYFFYYIESLAIFIFPAEGRAIGACHVAIHIAYSKLYSSMTFFDPLMVNILRYICNPISLLAVMTLTDGGVRLSSRVASYLSPLTLKASPLYRVVQKTGTIFTPKLPSNIDQFSNLVHCQNQEKICNNTITSSVSLQFLVTCQCLKSYN